MYALVQEMKSDQPAVSRSLLGKVPANVSQLQAEPVVATNVILVVEDSPAVRSLLLETLEGEGYEVIESTNGQEGLERARRQPVALVLLDLMMPVMDGWQFLEAAQHEPALAAVPIILLSASRELTTTALQNPAQVKAFLPKPFDLAQLLTCVQPFVKPKSV